MEPLGHAKAQLPWSQVQLHVPPAAQLCRFGLPLAIETLPPSPLIGWSCGVCGGAAAG